MTFLVTAIDPAGRRQRLTREAADRDSLAARLRAEGLVAVAIEESVREKQSGRDGFVFGRFTSFDVEMGLRQLAAMLKSGVSLTSALATVSEQADGKKARTVWSRVAERVRGGLSFAEALERSRPKFGGITVRLAEVGERSGELDKALARAADELEQRRNLRNAVVNALVYPFIAVALAIGVSAYLVTVVIPKLSEFLRAGGVELPPLTEALMDFADGVNAHGLAVLGWLGAAVAGWFALRLVGKGREFEDALLMRLPVVGRILRLSGTALFSRALEIMLSSGVTLLDALETSSGLLPNRRLSRRVREAREAVIAGGSLARALEPGREFLPMLRRMAAVGEATGSLPEAFAETARFHEMMLALAIKRFGMLIEPVMIVVTGLIVGFVYLAFFTALFALAGAA